MHDSQTKRYTAIFRLLALRKHKICIEMKYFLLEHTLLLLKSQKIQNYSFALVGTLHMYLMYVISNIFFVVNSGLRSLIMLQLIAPNRFRMQQSDD